MTRHEQLQERYEDALFALLMDELAAAEGQRAEEEKERLRDDPSAAVPEDLDRRCARLIRRHVARRRARTAGRLTWRAVKLAALAAGIAAILLTTVCAASETVRVNTLNLMIEVFETNTEFRFISDARGSVETAPQLEVGWVPDDYVLTDQGQDHFETWYEYRSAEDHLLSISCSNTTGMTVGIDTENAEVEYVSVQGERAMLIQKNSRVELVWPAHGNSLFLSIIGNEIDPSDVLQIAAALRY